MKLKIAKFSPWWVCWWFAKIYADENFLLYGKKSFIDYLVFLFWPLLIHISKEFWLDVNSISDGTSFWTCCLNFIFCDMSNLCLRYTVWYEHIWAAFDELFMRVMSLNDFLTLPLVSDLFPAYSGCLSVLASRLSNGVVALDNWHTVNRPTPARTMPVICVAAQPLIMVIETDPGMLHQVTLDG